MDPCLDLVYRGRHRQRSWDEKRAWFDDLNRALSGYFPQKPRMWDSIEDNFDRAVRDLTTVFAPNFRIGKIEPAPAPSLRPELLVDGQLQVN